MNKKRILFLNCDSLWFGSEKILLYSINILKNKHDCIPVLPYNGIFIDLLKKSGLEPIVIKYPVLRKKFMTFSGIFIFLFDFVISFFLLGNLVRKKHIEVIYSNSITVISGVFLSLILKKPHIWHIHGIIEKPVLLNYLLKKLIGFSDLNIFVSEELKNRYEFKTDKNKIVIHNGIESLSCSKRNHSDIFTIGTLGTFNEQKGQIFSVMAIKYLFDYLKPVKQVRLILQGPVYGKDSKWITKIRDFILQNNLNSIVSIKEFSFNIDEFYESIDLFISSSIIFDPFPTVVLEAISAGIPVTGFNSGGIAEMFDPSDTLCRQGDYIRLAELIFEFMNNPVKLKTVARIQKEQFEKSFMLKHYRTKFELVIDRFINEKR